MSINKMRTELIDESSFFFAKEAATNFKSLVMHAFADCLLILRQLRS